MNLARSLYLSCPGYLWVVIRKSAMMWLLVRLLLIAMLTLVIGLAAALHAPTYGIPVLLVWLDRKLFHEQLLQANLAGSELWMWAVSLVAVGGLDFMAALLLRLA